MRTQIGEIFATLWSFITKSQQINVYNKFSHVISVRGAENVKGCK